MKAHSAPDYMHISNRLMDVSTVVGLVGMLVAPASWSGYFTMLFVTSLVTSLFAFLLAERTKRRSY